jgi:hypothetical protein
VGILSRFFAIPASATIEPILSPRLSFLLHPTREAIRDESLANIEAACQDVQHPLRLEWEALAALVHLAEAGHEIDVYRPAGGGDFYNVWLRPTLADGDEIHPGWRIPDDEWQAHWPLYLRLVAQAVEGGSR